MTKKQTTIDNIFYYQEKPQDILNLSLKFSFEEIGFYLTFKASYFYHKGKIPTNKLYQFCRVFDNQEKFKTFIEDNFKINDGFYSCSSFDDEINFIQEKSKKKRDAINSRWQNTNVYTNVNTNESRLNILNNKHQTLNIKPKTINKKKSKGFIAPTLEEVKNYCQERNNTVNPAKFFDYYSTGNWEDGKGNKVKNWKQKLITWENRDNNSEISNRKVVCSDELKNYVLTYHIKKINVSASNKAILHFNKKDDFDNLTKLDNKVREEIKTRITKELNTNGFEFKY